jgi:DNA-binding transcriptional MerR regulator
MNEDRLYTEEEVRAIVAIERAEAEYLAIRMVRELVDKQFNTNG